MAAIALDRLLETCYRQDGADLLLVPGSPPMIRLKDGWRPLQIGPLHRQDVALLADQLMSKPQGETDGYAYHDFAYGEVARFRALAFGCPEPSILLIARAPRR